MIWLNEEIKLHIKKLQRRAALSLIAILLIIISIGFGLLFLFIPSFVAIIFFIIATVCIVYLLHSSRTVKKEAKENIYKPVVFNGDKNLTFEKIVSIFENLTNEENQLELAKLTNVLPANQKALDNNYFKNCSDDIQQQSRCISAEQLNNLVENEFNNKNKKIQEEKE